MRHALPLALAALALYGCERPEIAEAKKAVAAELRDPSSAQYRNLFMVGRLVCGEVNSRNGFGGYAGFTRFAASPGSVTIEPFPELAGSPPPTQLDDTRYAQKLQEGMFEAVWNHACGQSAAPAMRGR